METVSGVSSAWDEETLSIHKVLLYKIGNQHINTTHEKTKETSVRYHTDSLTFVGDFWDLRPAGMASTEILLIAMVPSLCDRLTRSNSDSWVDAAVVMVDERGRYLKGKVR